MPTWAIPTASLTLLIVAVAAVRRWRLMTLRWPAGISQLTLEKMCAVYLRRSGWEVKRWEQAYSSFEAYKDGIECLVACKVVGGAIGAMLLGEFHRYEGHVRRRALVYVEPPQDHIAADCLLFGVHILHYSHLNRLMEIVNTPLTPAVGVMADQEGVSTGGAMPDTEIRNAGGAEEGSQAKEQHTPEPSPAEWIEKAQGADPEEAFALLQEAARLFPASSQIHHDLARQAERRGDWEFAETAWRNCIAADPNHWWAHLGLAAVLARLGRPQEADALMETALSRFPNQPTVLAHHAEAATLAGDRPEAQRRWDQVIERFPNAWDGYRGKAALLSASGRGDEADALIRESAAAFPTNGDALHDRARLAEREGDWPTASRCWQSFLIRGSQLWWAHQSLVRAFVKLGQFVQAEEAYQQAVPMFPREEGLSWDYVDNLVAAGEHSAAAKVVSATLSSDLHLSVGALLLFGRAAVSAEDWDLAIACARRLRNEYPSDAGTGRFLSSLQLDLIKAEPEKVALLTPFRTDQEMAGISRVQNGDLSTSGGADPIPIQEVALRFESLGGGDIEGRDWGFGCEFGFWQRDTGGVEPLGLFRWASILPEHLTLALNERLDQIDNPDQLTAREHIGWDWGITHKIYLAHWDHTDLRRSEVPEHKARITTARIFKFLQQKLLEDLVSGEKIFVYRMFNGVLPDDKLNALCRAVNSYGNNVLLYVRIADEENAPGTVRRVHAGLLIGYIDTFATRPGQIIYNPTGWEAVCRAALNEIDSTARSGAHHGGSDDAPT